MTAQQRFTMIGGRVARFTKLDKCGRVDYGDESRLVTEGFITITATANIDAGTEVTVPNANGVTKAHRAAKPKHNGWTVEVAFVGVDPFALNFLTANPLVHNGAGDIAGFDQDTEVAASDANVALEVWTDTGDGDVCSAVEDELIGYLLFPWLQGGVISDFTVANDAINFTVSAAASKTGHEWGTGPYLVDVDGSGDGTALATVPSSVALRALEVGLTPPGETNGAIPLDDPSAAAATSAVAGTPGHFLPTGAFRPETLADMTGLTASPTTAWTTGQKVELQDGSYAKWSGTAWVATT